MSFSPKKNRCKFLQPKPRQDEFGTPQYSSANITSSLVISFAKNTRLPKKIKEADWKLFTMVRQVIGEWRDGGGGKMKWRAQHASRHNERMRQQSPFCPALHCFALKCFLPFLSSRPLRYPEIDLRELHARAQRRGDVLALLVLCVLGVIDKICLRFSGWCAQGQGQWILQEWEIQWGPLCCLLRSPSLRF